MRCTETRENLVAWLDGELSPEEAERVESHLASCPECMRERAALETSGDLLSRLAPASVPGNGLAARVLKAVKSGVEPWCLHIRRELVAFLDGELDETAARPVREHLAECEGCEHERRALARTGAALATWKLPPLDARIVDRLPMGARRRKKGRLLRFVPAAAAAAVLVAASFAGYRLSVPTSDPGANSAPYPDAEVLKHLELLKAQARVVEEIDRDPEIVDMEKKLRWIDGYSEDEIALLTEQGG